MRAQRSGVAAATGLWIARGRLADRLAVGLLLGLWSLARLWMFWPARHGFSAEARFGDMGEYLRISRLPLTSWQFYTEGKPFGYPLVLKLFGRHQELILGAQLGASLVAWAILAFVLARRVRPRWRFVAFVAVLGFSLSWQVAQWDTLLGTESFSLSLFALLVALLLLCFDEPTWARVAAMVPVALAFTALRDTNAVISAFALGGVGLFWFVRERSLRTVALIVCAVACVVLVASTTGEKRWQILVADQIGKRVESDPQQLAYFEAHGMPNQPKLSHLIFVDTRHTLPNQTFLDDPRLATFMAWFVPNARHTYYGYLLSHLGTAIVQPTKLLPRMLGDGGLTTYRNASFRPLPEPIDSFVYPSSGDSVLRWDACLLGLYAIGGLLGLVRRRWLAPLVLVGLTLPLAIVVWDGEASEVARHSLLTGVAARLALLTGAFLVVPELLAAAKRAVTASRSRSPARVSGQSAAES